MIGEDVPQAERPFSIPPELVAPEDVGLKSQHECTHDIVLPESATPTSLYSALGRAAASCCNPAGKVKLVLDIAKFWGYSEPEVRAMLLLAGGQSANSYRTTT